MKIIIKYQDFEFHYEENQQEAKYPMIANGTTSQEHVSKFISGIILNIQEFLKEAHKTTN